MSQTPQKTKITINISPKITNNPIVKNLQEMTDEEFRNIVKNSYSLAEIARKTGVKSTHGIKVRLSNLQEYEKAHLIGGKSALDLIPEEELKDLVLEAKSYTDVAVKLGYTVNIGNIIPTIKTKLEEKNIATDHFMGSANHGRSKLSQRTKDSIIKDAGNKCSICGTNDSWNGKPLKLHVDHINGVPHDNSRANLRAVCPNCHSQLDTTGSRNRNSITYRMIQRIQNAQATCSKCPQCGKLILTKGSQHCADCHNMKSRKTIRPLIEDVFTDVKDLTYKGAAEKHGVTDTTVRKWFLFAGYNPPTHKDIKNNLSLQDLKK